MSTTTSRVLKHSLNLTVARVLVIRVPAGSRPLSAALQAAPDGSDRIVLWTIGSADGPMVTRRVVLVQTGHPINDEIVASCDHVDTVAWVAALRAADGEVQAKPMVEHVFLERDPSAN